MAQARAGALPLRRLWRTTLPDYPMALAWSPDGSALLAVPATGEVLILAAEDAHVLGRYPGHAGGNLTAAWSPSAPLIATGGQDGQVRLHALDPATPARSFGPGRGWIEKLEWSSDGYHLAVGQGKKVHLLRPDLTPIFAWAAHAGTVADLTWSSNGERVAVAAYTGLVVWNKQTDQPERTLEWDGSSLKVAWSPNGTILASGDQTPTVHLWNLETNDSLVMRGYETKVTALAWTHDSRFLATAGGFDAVIWDCSGVGPEGSEPITLEGHSERISCLAFQHRNNLLASGDADGLALVWWPERHPAPLLAFLLNAPVAAVAWHPSDAALAIASASGEINLCRLPTEAELA